MAYVWSVFDPFSVGSDMAASWHMGNLDRYLGGSPSIFDEGIDPLRSLTTAHNLLLFHYHQSVERLKIVGPFGDSPIDDFARVLEVREEDMDASVALAAHVYAAVGLTRDAYDYMAQLLNALASRARMAAHDVSAERVFPLVRPGRVRAQCDQVRESNAYAYVVAFNNLTKHQRALPFGFSVNIETGSHFGPPAFTKLGKQNTSHRATKPSEILSYCKELWRGIDTIGQLVNEERGVANRLT
jgi:hypothetical protein